MKRSISPFLGLLFVSSAPVLLAGGVVSSINDVSLRTALAGGGTVTFSTSGTVLLTNTLSITSDTVIDGAGQTVAISGDNAFRVFQVSPGVNFTLLNLSIINGRTTEGAAVLNDGGSVVVSNCVFTGNMAIGIPGSNGIDVGSPGMPGSGGAIYSAGSLIVLDSAFLTNRTAGGDGGAINPIGLLYPLAAGSGASGSGGAIYASGFVGLTNCTFWANGALGGTGGGVTSDVGIGQPGDGAEGSGGAIHTTGTLNASNSHFSLNYSKGGDGGSKPITFDSGLGGDASGGSIFCASGNVSLVDCSFNGNSASSGISPGKYNPHRGIARGGAICGISNTVMIASCYLNTNTLSGVPVFGGGLFQQGGNLIVSKSSINGNWAVTDEYSTYYDLNGAPAWGGGLYSDADAVITDSIFATNRLQGGRVTLHMPFSTLKGGPAYGAGVCSVGNIQLNRCTLEGNLAVGGACYGYDMTPPAGDAFGAGAYFATNAAHVINCTLSGNTAQGGTIGSAEHFGPGGDAYGGGLYTFLNTTSLTNCTLAGNKAIPGLGWTNEIDGKAYGGNVAVKTGTLQMLNTILSAGVSSNAYGTITDLGHNISSDTSCAFTAPGSMNNANPKLLPLANNGGFTPTMALLPDSPAIDNAATVAGADVDQRGVTRPYGTAPDIGSYEWNADGVVTSADDFSLRSALAGGGTVTFSTSGTVLLTNTLSITSDTVIDGAGQTVAISGNNAFRVFQVSPGVNLTLLNLSIINGRTNEGAAVFNDGGNVVVSNCVFTGNMAIGIPGSDGTDIVTLSGKPGNGGAIYSSGSLIAMDSSFLTNRAAGGDGGGMGPYATSGAGNGASGSGGAIYASGLIGLTNCTFLMNGAMGGIGGSGAGESGGSNPGKGGEGRGGAIYAIGPLNASNSHFSLNYSKGGDGGKNSVEFIYGIGGASSGGSIFCTSGSVSLVDCSFNGNSASSGTTPGRDRPHRGIARGGAICCFSNTVMIASCRLNTNTLSGVPVFGGGLYQQGGSLVVSRSSINGNSAVTDEYSIYYEANGAPGWGGGMYIDADALITDSTFATNRLHGGLRTFTTGLPPLKAGPAYGAGLCSVGNIELNRCLLVGNLAMGGTTFGAFPTPPAGDAFGGGAYFATNAARVINCTLTGNTAQGGTFASPELFGAGGDAYGGGLYIDRNTTSLTNCTLAGNKAVPGLGWTNDFDGKAYGGNVAVQTGTIHVLNTILSAGVSSNAYGTITDLGHNISSDTSCALTAPGSMNNANPKLLPLANNGGFTPTMALLPDSPAIDNAGGIAGMDVDQRGVTRPYGTAPDIGAYEWNATSFYTEFSLSIVRNNGQWTIPVVGPPLTTVRIQRSPDLVHWSTISTNTTSSTGKVLIDDPQATSPSYYRTLSD